MTKRKPVEPALGPLEDYARRFGDLLANRAQRQGFRRYVEGLLLSDERNKTLTALANTEPVAGPSACLSSESAVVSHGVELGPRGGEPSQGGVDARRSQDGPYQIRRSGNRRARRP